VKRAEKAARVQGILSELYPETPVPLDHGDPFTLLVAVLLSAQTTDKKVNEVTPALFAAAPTPAALAAMPEPDIKHFIRQIGLANTKAKNLKRLGELLVERHGGQVPADFDALEALPGVGHKTASIVLLFCFNMAAFPVDTHIQRQTQRLGISDRKASPEKIKGIWEALLHAETFYALHVNLIHHGREVCQARTPRCEICVLQAQCDYFQQQGEWR
jgi:endonuclease-3